MVWPSDDFDLQKQSADWHESKLRRRIGYETDEYCNIVSAHLLRGSSIVRYLYYLYYVIGDK